MSCAFAAIRKDLHFGPEVIVYAFRHRYITDVLLRGVQPATVAALVRHRDLTMIMRHYAHLKDHPEHLREAAASTKAADCLPGIRVTKNAARICGDPSRLAVDPVTVRISWLLKL